LGQQGYGAWLLELGIDGRDVQVSFAEINIFGPDFAKDARPVKELVGTDLNLRTVIF
jgi:hypothetical protein